MAKINNHTMDKLELSNSRSFIDYLDEDSLRIYPGKDEWRKRLCYTMLKWGDREDALDIIQFCRAYKIPKSTLQGWVNRYPDIEKAFNEMKLFLGCNRRIGAMTRKLDTSAAYRDMHELDESWDRVNKYHAKLKTDLPEASGIKYIEVPVMPSTSIVPEKKNEARDHSQT